MYPILTYFNYVFVETTCIPEIYCIEKNDSSNSVQHIKTLYLCIILKFR